MAHEAVPEESDKIKELKKKMQKFEEKLKECSTQQLIVMQAEIINELANRYNKEGGINPNSEGTEVEIERARDAPCKDNGLTYKERVDRYHGFQHEGRIMHKVTIEPTKLKQFLDILKAFVDEFRLEITESGWHVAAVDPANVAMIDVTLPKDEFLALELVQAGGEPLKVGVDITHVKNFIAEGDKLYDSTTLISMELMPDPKGGTLDYVLLISQGGISQQIKLLSEESIRKLPQWNGSEWLTKEGKTYKWEHKFTVELKDLQFFCQCLSRAHRVNAWVRLTVHKGKDELILETEGDNGRPWHAVVPAKVTPFDQSAETATSLFSLDYLEDIVKAIPYPHRTVLPENLRLSLGTDVPLLMQFGIGSKGTAHVVIAPRVE